MANSLRQYPSVIATQKPWPKNKKARDFSRALSEAVS
jgi:hypothetical protein